MASPRVKEKPRSRKTGHPDYAARPAQSKPSRTSASEEIISEIERQLGSDSIDNIYKDSVLTGRTRRYELHAPAKESSVEIIHTLLGIELKMNKRRLICPDLATSRYLAVFARIGCDSVAIPYDITKISLVADKLESSWHQMCLLVEHLARDRSERLRSLVRRRLISDLRVKIVSLGSGENYPDFPAPRRRRPTQNR